MFIQLVRRFVGAEKWPTTSLCFLLQFSVDYIEITNEGKTHVMDSVIWILVYLFRQLSNLIFSSLGN